MEVCHHEVFHKGKHTHHCALFLELDGARPFGLLSLVIVGRSAHIDNRLFQSPLVAGERVALRFE